MSRILRAPKQCIFVELGDGIEYEIIGPSVVGEKNFDVIEVHHEALVQVASSVFREIDHFRRFRFSVDDDDAVRVGVGDDDLASIELDEASGLAQPEPAIAFEPSGDVPPRFIDPFDFVVVGIAVDSAKRPEMQNDDVTSKAGEGHRHTRADPFHTLGELWCMNSSGIH